LATGFGFVTEIRSNKLSPKLIGPYTVIGDREDYVIVDWNGEGSRNVSKERIVQVTPRAEKTEPNDVEGDLEKEYVIDKIIAADRGDKGHPKYRIRWEGYTAEDDTWEPVVQKQQNHLTVA
jgi:Chromo (CHRromatin Organisation MOdifier) domain